MKYIVETEMYYGWDNCWSDEDGTATTFASGKEAQRAIDELIDDIKNAVNAGLMRESMGNYRVVRL